jgi:transcription initiation factor TFIIIB Brf1 subunit/transcription initiation factor TFIIB
MLTEEQKEFLVNYRPENKKITTKEEIKKIIEVIKPSREMRNNVIEYYDELLDAEYINGKRTEKYFEIFNAMQSVATVLDFKYLQYNV